MSSDLAPLFPLSCSRPTTFFVAWTTGSASSGQTWICSRRVPDSTRVPAGRGSAIDLLCQGAVSARCHYNMRHHRVRFATLRLDTSMVKPSELVLTERLCISKTKE
ncbi:hypothetical protein BCV70DRAFT_48353 [Testicularia cyperi]|uniref:Uncharacterized protein n=1 Tax=Testicularia cyperi TaxID=1882483 RepID=A0A317XH74_9BASI|nr:hypothetical protein BCV70DRAFT_48353 [Testicularia cyperi]